MNKYINVYDNAKEYTNAGIFVVRADITYAMRATLLRRRRYITTVLRHTSFAS